MEVGLFLFQRKLYFQLTAASFLVLPVRTELLRPAGDLPVVSSGLRV
ncbi:hypothetical protein [Paenibacillus sp. 1_12]|nr:hypothetical protein [Paenibacillus sp. 1_12]